MAGKKIPAKLIAKSVATEAPKTPSERRALDVDGVCKLIEAGGRAGLKSLRFGPLELEFEKPLDDIVIEEAIPRRQTRLKDGQLQPTDSAQDADELETASEDRLMQMEHLKLTDPQAYEELLLSGEAEDGDGT